MTADTTFPDPSDAAPGPSPSGVVELTIPVESDLLVLARLAVSTISSRSGFDIEEIEDLRLAVDELCLSVLDGRRSGRLHLRFDGLPARIEVACHYEGDEPAPDRNREDRDDLTEELSGRILDALVDEHGPVDRDGRRGAHLAKRRAERDV